MGVWQFPPGGHLIVAFLVVVCRAGSNVETSSLVELGVLCELGVFLLVGNVTKSFGELQGDSAKTQGNVDSVLRDVSAVQQKLSRVSGRYDEVKADIERVKKDSDNKAYGCVRSLGSNATAALRI